MTDPFKGRIGRDRYWRLTGLCALAFGVAFFSIVLTINNSNVIAFVLVVIGVFLFFATCVALLGAGVRRLHDRGKSGFWIISYYVVPAVLVVLSADPNGQRDPLSYVALAILVWAIIDLGIREGVAPDTA